MKQQFRKGFTQGKEIVQTIKLGNGRKMVIRLPVPTKGKKDND